MKIFKCLEPCRGYKPCIVIIQDDGAEPENCPYEGWTENKYPKWEDINKLESGLTPE